MPKSALAHFRLHMSEQDKSLNRLPMVVFRISSEQLPGPLQVCALIRMPQVVDELRSLRMADLLFDSTNLVEHSCPSLSLQQMLQYITSPLISGSFQVTSRDEELTGVPATCLGPLAITDPWVGLSRRKTSYVTLLCYFITLLFINSIYFSLLFYTLSMLLLGCFFTSVATTSLVKFCVFEMFLENNQSEEKGMRIFTVPVR